MTGLKDLDIAVPATEEWLGDLMQRLGWQDRERVYLALLAALHALRDCLPFEEAVYVGALLSDDRYGHGIDLRFWCEETGRLR